MIGQRILRIIYKKRPNPNSILYRETVDHIRDIDSDTLDLGGGPGYLHLFIKEKCYYVVQDIDFKVLSYGDHLIDKVLAPAEEKIFRDNTFNYIIIHDALHHFQDIDQVFKSIYGISKKYILIFEVELGNLIGKFIKYLEILLGFPGNFYSSKELIRMVQDSKLGSISEVIKTGRFRYLIKVDTQPQS
ncbi:TPA: class I SAM-dependent methyltransferase [Candidatus Geothermarchaeota archaeon]|nr:class I SAM-dependent methyltransferase [Candidatus Geothermarchaeota archaeon]